MINKSIEILKEQISGERAYRYVEGITRYHRVQASRGYREAAEYCAELLKTGGVETEIFSFPADEKTKYWTQRTFKEWNCTDAKLELVSPKTMTLADYQADCLSIVQRSIPCQFTDMPVDIVMIEKDRRGDYEDIDLAGKIIFISEDPNGYLDWAARKQVYGMITDYMSDVFVRQRNDLYDDRLFLCFTWMKEETDRKTFSFILTPRLGDHLRKICKEVDAEYKKGNCSSPYPQVKGYIDAEFCDGTMEDVVAVIPGETEEEVLLLAHLCHAKACANDNASGCGGAIEIMKTLRNLIDKNILPKPKRGIRMILVPEVVGTYAYLASHEEDIGKIKAGIDIDMIGRKQEGECGLVGIMGVPDSTPSFVQDLASYIVEENSRDIATFNIDEYVTPVHTQLLNYVGGSDHYILCDPTVGIPCIIMMQWLDSNYHSSADSIDQLDPNILKKNCCVAASYLYTLANLQVKDSWYIMNEGRARFTKRMLRIVKEQTVCPGNYASLRDFLTYQKDVAIRAAGDYRRFFDGAELEAVEGFIKREVKYINEFTENLLEEYCGEDKPGTDEKPKTDEMTENNGSKKYRMIPVRLMKGPITFVGFFNGLSEELQAQLRSLKQRYPEFYGINSMNDFILHRVNGKSTVMEIAWGAALEGRLYNPEYVYEYLSFLGNAGLVAFQA